MKLTIEATSVVIEWSHDVCRFLLKWFPGWALKKFKSAEKSSGEKNDVSSSFGMHTVHTVYRYVSAQITCSALATPLATEHFLE